MYNLLEFTLHLSTTLQAFMPFTGIEVSPETISRSERAAVLEFPQLRVSLEINLIFRIERILGLLKVGRMSKFLVSKIWCRTGVIPFADADARGRIDQSLRDNLGSGRITACRVYHSVRACRNVPADR